MHAKLNRKVIHKVCAKLLHPTLQTGIQLTYSVNGNLIQPLFAFYFLHAGMKRFYSHVHT